MGVRAVKRIFKVEATKDGSVVLTSYYIADSKEKAVAALQFYWLNIKGAKWSAEVE